MRTTTLIKLILVQILVIQLCLAHKKGHKRGDDREGPRGEKQIGNGDRGSDPRPEGRQDPERRHRRHRDWENQDGQRVPHRKPRLDEGNSGSPPIEPYPADGEFSKNRGDGHDGMQRETDFRRGRHHRGHRRWGGILFIGSLICFGMVLGFLICAVVIGVKVINRCLRRRNRRQAALCRSQQVNIQANSDSVNDYVNINSVNDISTPVPTPKPEVNYPNFDNLNTTSKDFSKHFDSSSRNYKKDEIISDYKLIK